MLLKQIGLKGRGVPKEEGEGPPNTCNSSATLRLRGGSHLASALELIIAWWRGGGGRPSPPFLLTIADKVLVPDTILTWITTT